MTHILIAAGPGGGKSRALRERTARETRPVAHTHGGALARTLDDIAAPTVVVIDGAESLCPAEWSLVRSVLADSGSVIELVLTAQSVACVPEDIRETVQVDLV